MTFTARQVLSDCRVALELLEEEKDLQRWRVHWAAAVALVRAVGHVLDKTDGRDRSIKKIASRHFREWKRPGAEHEIYREFIEKERNNLLKEYQIGVHPSEEVGVLVQYTLQPVHGGEPVQLNQVHEIDENIYRPMLNSFREGDDARDVLADAIEWWERQLDRIDEDVAKVKADRSD